MLYYITYVGSGSSTGSNSVSRRPRSVFGIIQMYIVLCILPVAPLWNRKAAQVGAYRYNSIVLYMYWQWLVYGIEGCVKVAQVTHI